ncbi:DUF1878 family protein [Bacillus sp. FJAT-42376]|uniref:DUF1878 family protein n=1 Tax=Bacillus sp. FJAT-42376 TaxID=2014076 RepID=UPI000F514DA7|nr:DUF1878 family protein [Bacillus sp. FJAT-42376]AZB42237.1 DUF1878 family protein [Bacillus sp. FJAT-42376]
MDLYEERLNRLEFQMRLLLSMVRTEDHPFTYMVIQKQLPEKEYVEVLELCRRLEELHQKQKAQGFVHFEGLLTLFVQELNDKLEVKETAEALFREGMFPGLMRDFLSMLESY